MNSLIEELGDKNLLEVKNFNSGTRIQKTGQRTFDYYEEEDKGKSLSKALLFAEHGENMLCTKIVLNVRNNFCTQHVLPRFELGIFMY